MVDSSIDPQVAIEHIALMLIGHIEGDPDYGIAQAQAQDAGDGWGFDTPGPRDSFEEWTRWREVHLGAANIQRAWELAWRWIDDPLATY